MTTPATTTGDRTWRRTAAAVVLWGLVAGLTLWAIGALAYDFPVKAWRKPVAAAYALAAIAVAVLADRKRRGASLWPRATPVVVCRQRRGFFRWVGAVPAAGWLALGFAGVLAWWLTLRPSNDRPWQPDVARTAWAEIEGDRVTLHNVRHGDYRTETDYTPRWETRTVDLGKLRGIDLAINYWGSALMAHPIASFQFEDAPPVCFSIETRKEIGESYSAIGGLYRQYELIYVCADERDVLRVRTNFRHGEDVYLYRLTATPEQARKRFLEYVTAMNALHARPRWYHALTTNCTTSVRTQRTTHSRAPWDWRLLVNGYADEMLAERGAFAGGLPFPELKRRARINEAALAAGDAPEFSRLIRAGRPGFEPAAASW